MKKIKWSELQVIMDTAKQKSITGGRKWSTKPPTAFIAVKKKP